MVQKDLSENYVQFLVKKKNQCLDILSTHQIYPCATLFPKWKSLLTGTQF